jgi:hypothetical protein
LDNLLVRFFEEAHEIEIALSRIPAVVGFALAFRYCLNHPSSSSRAGQVMGDAVDVSQDFQKMGQVYFIGERVASFDPATARGTLEWMRHQRR